MSLELRSSDNDAIKALWLSWSATTNTELEAAIQNLDYTGFLNVIRYLRSLGLMEVSEEPKLNIHVDGGLRFTIVGEGAISQYCRDNTLADKMYEVLLKERKLTGAAGISEVDLREYGVRVKVRREQALTRDTPRVMEAVSKWATLPKSFRHIKRFSFTSAHHRGLQFDASVVRESRKNERGTYLTSTTFTGAQLNTQPLHYEMEIEALRGRGGTRESFLLGITSVLRGVQGSHVLVRNTVKQFVLDEMARRTSSAPNSFPGSQPVTLRKEHMEMVEPKSAEATAEEGSGAAVAATSSKGAKSRAPPVAPNLRNDDYNVTDKADGMRCLLFVAADGRVYLIDRNLRVYGTDRMLEGAAIPGMAGTLLDGEWITQDRSKKPISTYLAFDIFNKGGQSAHDVTGLPFYSRASAAASASSSSSSATTAAAERPPDRLSIMQDVVRYIEGAKHVFATIPEHRKLTIGVKHFSMARKLPDKKGVSLFREASATLDRAALAPYETDGLIFTPNAAPLPKNVKTWREQFKWKPASMNSVDFLVKTEKERTIDGRSTGVELVGNRLRDDTNQIVRHKTLRLFVGGDKHPAFVNPRETVLNMSKLPETLHERATYRAIEFSPEPPDPMASVCYVPVAIGAAAQLSEEAEDAIYCEETGDPISDLTVVEMKYEPHNSPGWRWVPMRVRWDKTELYARREMSMNNEVVANDVWSSIHDPITVSMIRTGGLTEDAEEAAATGGEELDEGAGVAPRASVAAAEVGSEIYYQRKASQRDLLKVRGLADFHNKYIKGQILLGSTMTRGCKVLDMSVGQAGDLHKWIQGEVGFVLGCDLAKTGLIDPRNGAYRRYLDQIIDRRGDVCKMIFVNADSSQRYRDGTAGIVSEGMPHEKAILRALWGAPKEVALPEFIERNRGIALGQGGLPGFDVVSLMFTLHYFFKSKEMLDGLIGNINETLKFGGYFVGCCFDGDRVAAMLRDLPVGGTERGAEDDRNIWSITKQYEDTTGSVPATDEGIGRAIDVFFMSIGEARREYLVSFPYLVQRLEAIGVELLKEDECAALRLHHSTNLFSDSYDMARAQRLHYPMSPAVQSFSFLNRWFIFRRRASAPMPPEAATQGIPPLPPSTGTSLGPRLEIGGEVVAAATEATGATEAAAPSEAANAATAEDDEVADKIEAEARAAADGTLPATEGGGTHLSDGPLFQFYHKSGAKDDLKIGDKNWRRYLSPYHPFSYKDPKNASVVYPSLEAAMGAALFQLATDKPELGAQLFSVTGNIAQETATKRVALAGKPDDLAALVEEEGTKMHTAYKPVALRKVKAKFNSEAWEEQKQRILVEYVHQRFTADKHLRDILEAVAHKKGRLVYFTAGGATDLSAVVKDDAIEGENLLGRAYLREVGFRMA